MVRQLQNLGCTYVAVGYPFRDEDYMYDYLHYIGGSFRDYGRHCIRLHFFSGPDPPKFPTIEDYPDDLARQTASQACAEAYLGFMVIRPTGKDCV